MCHSTDENFAESVLSLPPVFSDGMVLQRGTPVKIWGKAPGRRAVTIHFLGAVITAVASETGAWSAALAPHRAGGPFCMQISCAGREIIIRDILFGEVWLCSGQSNMELPMARVADRYAEEIARCKNPEIRFLNVNTQYDLQRERDTFPTPGWQPVDPYRVLSLSAAAYFFARRLCARLGCPVGVIVAAVGGTPVAAWMSERALAPFPSYLAERDRCLDAGANEAVNARENAEIAAWHSEADERDAGLAEGWSMPDVPEEGWGRIPLPNFWGDAGFSFSPGVIWLRREFQVPAAYAGQSAMLILGTIVDTDAVYINGVFVGSTSYRYPPRQYPVAGELLRPGGNTIAVRVYDETGHGGVTPGKSLYLRFFNFMVDLTGVWRVRQGAALSRPAVKMTPFERKPTGLFNGMIAPLVPYAMKGVIWYQGENNAHRPCDYRELFAAMIEDWRARFGHDFPFLYVQLPEFDTRSGQEESHWPELREQQRQALSVAGTAMVVALGLGEWNDLHPTAKKEVGERLALAAEDVAYGIGSASYQGPVLQSARREGDEIALAFGNSGAGLMTKDGRAPGAFTVSGSGAFVPAAARIAGSRVIISLENAGCPVTVRYAWADDPADANLCNSDGFMASPFTITIDGSEYTDEQ